MELFMQYYVIVLIVCMQGYDHSVKGRTVKLLALYIYYFYIILI